MNPVKICAQWTTGVSHLTPVHRRNQTIWCASWVILMPKDIPKILSHEWAFFTETLRWEIERSLQKLKLVTATCYTEISSRKILRSFIIRNIFALYLLMQMVSMELTVFDGSNLEVALIFHLHLKKGNREKRNQWRELKTFAIFFSELM